ncbi:MAG: type II CRISPR-associated endonuclease Cas1 [Flavobacteriales bacterium]|nr:type II CRISPR-associated endonuclease Cas1 [Flavobacteriales bacterium]
MIKRTLYFGSAARLSRKDAQLHVAYPEESGQESKTVPIEDIGIVILDNPQVQIGQALLSSLLENNVAVVCTDSRHMPAGMFLNYQGHSEMAEIYAAQIEASLPLKKNLWQQTIEQKITNQANVLKRYEQPHDDMLALAKLVRSGDPANNEGQAAAIYWRRLFDPELGFKRGRYEDGPNNVLNYGYAILRAVVARSVCGSGMLPALGIHHRNKYNPYCLADDVMEPYRPFVDIAVCQIVDSDIDYSELTPALKKELLQIPAMDVQIDGEKSPLMIATQRTTASLARCFKGESRTLLYPQLE